MTPKLIIADSESDSNMFYATGFLVVDDFIYLDINGKKIIYVSDLEFDRAKVEAVGCVVKNYSEYFDKDKKGTFANILINILKENKIKLVQVPDNFKIKYAKILIENGVDIDVKKIFFKKREIKTDDEINKIIEVQRVNEKAMQAVFSVLEDSKIRKDGKLSYKNKILTSEYINEVINIVFLKNGCYSESNIVSCGRDSAQPHNLGKGVLFANQFIVVDIFPKSKLQGYFADMTRTFVKGKATVEMKKMYNAVLGAQKIAFNKIKAGIKADLIHKKVQDYFEKTGFRTELKNGKIQGFFHSTGHGVGLDIHESPNIGLGNKKSLKVGNVITVEPGLYYPEIGGVRIEDLVLLTETGCKKLTKFPKVLEIK